MSQYYDYMRIFDDFSPILATLETITITDIAFPYIISESLKNKQINIEGTIYKHGDSVTCFIHNNKIDDAKIYISDERPDGVEIYICQDIISGNPAPGNLGYQFSWYTVIDKYHKICSLDGVRMLKKKQIDCFEGIVEQSFPKR
jgi:hypothetical protein